ncbi:MAG: hypothetical protein HY791_13255 [Deltaproteobacteria bacterium]|nr:hypothetical protein [Deltaproteobacteria bacterium]
MRVGAAVAVCALSACAHSLPASAPQTDSAEDFDVVTLALIVSGYESTEGLAQARVALERKVTPILAAVDMRDPPEVRAHTLLRALHGRQLLRTYDPRATTLREIIDEGRFNCVSAAALYNLLAERLRLNVYAELLPSHARSVVVVPSGAIFVEPTSRDGFDPDPPVRARILRRLQIESGDSGDTIAEGGSPASIVGLLAAIYVNRASIAQEAGDVSRAERLIARAQAMGETWEMKALLRSQRAALLAQLASDDLASDDVIRVERAHRTLLSAAKLQPEDPRIAAAVSTNLRASTERLLARDRVEKRDSALLLTQTLQWLLPNDSAGLLAFALAERSLDRVAAGDLVGALEASEEALSLPIAARDTNLRATIEENQIAALRMSAMAWAERGEYDNSMRMIARVKELAETRGGASPPFLESDRLRALHLIGLRWLDEKRYDQAAEVLREGLRLSPNDSAAKHNLRVALEHLVKDALSRNVCDLSTLEEIEALDPSDPFPRQARARCLSIEAASALDAGDQEEAVTLLREARAVDPSAPNAVRNLGVALLHLAHSLAADGHCDRAEKVCEEIEALPTDAIGKGDTTEALGPCAPKR